jgi:hypothetical protein
VEHSIAGKDRPRAVVQPHRDADHDGRLGVAKAFGRTCVDVGVSERFLVLRHGGPKERRIPFEGRLLDRDFIDPGHERECSAGASASVLAAHEQLQAVQALDDDRVAGVRAFRADRRPSLAFDSDLTLGPALRERDAFRADQRLGTDLRPPPAREADPEAGLTDLDQDPRDDRRDPPARREDEDRQEDGDDECD